MDVTEKRIQTFEDDGSSLAAGQFTQTLVYMGRFTGAVNAWFEFNDIVIPAGAVIGDNSYLELTAFNLSMPATSVHLKFYLNKVAHAVAPVSNSDYNDKVLTTAVTAYDPAAWVTDTAYQVSIKAQIEELQSLFDFSAGLDVLVLAIDNNSVDSAEIIAYDYAQNPNKAALLHIEWVVTPPPPAPVPPTPPSMMETVINMMMIVMIIKMMSGMFESDPEKQREKKEKQLIKKRQKSFDKENK